MAETIKTENEIQELPEKIETGKKAPAKKGKKKGKKIPKWLIIVLAAIILIVAVVVIRKVTTGNDAKAETNTATVSYGNVTKVIEGEGTIEVDRYQATSLVKGEIIADYIEEGDYVEKDQVLYEIDSGDMENSITRAENSLKTARNNYQQALEDIEELNITAPISGVIKELKVSEGDQVSNGTVIAQVVDSSVMKLKINFLEDDVRHMYVGQPATARLTVTGETLEGTVNKISTGALVNADGVSVSMVEMLVSNPGAIVPGDKATAMAGSFACTEAGTFEYNGSESITAKQSGKIRNLKYDTSDKITAGAVLANIENTSLKNNLESAQISLENAQLSLDDLYDTLDDYKIKSTIAGKVIQKNSKLGDKIDNSNAQTVMAIVSDPSELSFEMSVDELDIVNIKEGQGVQITADALDGQKFVGHVDNVSEVGTASNGVTTYPVKIIVDVEEGSGLIPGMNVDAVITIDSRSNVLVVPNSAIQRGNIVYVKKDGRVSSGSDTKAPESGREAEEKTPESKKPEGMSGGEMSESGGEKTVEMTSKNAPDGFEAVKVEVGLSDESYIEIISGLSEGDVVAVQESRNSSNSFMMGGMMGSGMPGGGMPGGGMPDGGMPDGGMAGGGGGAPRG